MKIVIDLTDPLSAFTSALEAAAFTVGGHDCETFEGTAVIEDLFSDNIPLSDKAFDTIKSVYLRSAGAQAALRCIPGKKIEVVMSGEDIAVEIGGVDTRDGMNSEIFATLKLAYDALEAANTELIELRKLVPKDAGPEPVPNQSIMAEFFASLGVKAAPTTQEPTNY